MFCQKKKIKKNKSKNKVLSHHLRIYGGIGNYSNINIIKTIYFLFQI